MKYIIFVSLVALAFSATFNYDDDYYSADFSDNDDEALAMHLLSRLKRIRSKQHKFKPRLDETTTTTTNGYNYNCTTTTYTTSTTTELTTTTNPSTTTPIPPSPPSNLTEVNLKTIFQ